MTTVVFGDHDQRRRDWLQASVEVTRCLLSSTGEDPLEAVARAVNQVAEADLTLVALPALDGDSVIVEVAVGEGTGDLIGFVFAGEGSVTGEVIRSAQAVLAADIADRPGGNRVPDAPTESLVGGGRPFDAEDLDLATSFANHAAIALELADVRAYQQRMIRLEDRHRIAAELHDHVLQRLFAAGMSMQAMAASVGAPHADRLEQLIADTDDTIGRIRAVIRHLNDLGPGLLSGP